MIYDQILFGVRSVPEHGIEGEKHANICSSMVNASVLNEEGPLAKNQCFDLFATCLFWKHLSLKSQQHNRVGHFVLMTHGIL